MIEALHPDPGNETNFVAKARLELVDKDYVKKQQLVAELLQHHRDDFGGMDDYPGNPEKTNFLNFLRTTLSRDEDPAVSEAARKFLEETGEIHEN